MFRHALLSLTALSMLAPATQAVELPEGAVMEDHVQLTMRDGARMNTSVILPDQSGGKFPAILVRTPYDSELDRRDDVLERLLAKGYAIVHQHERGRYFSEGRYEMLGGSLNDGWDTMDWITAQDWSDGQIGTLGCSSSAENQMKLGAAGHPAHKAMVAQSAGVGIDEVGPFHEHGNFWRGGVWQQGWMDYFLTSTVQDWPQLPEGLSSEDRQKLLSQFSMTNKGWERDAADFNNARMHLPMIDISDEMDAPQNELRAYLDAGPVSPIWNKERVSEGEKIAVPTLWTEAIYDISSRSTVAFFEWNRQANLADGNDNQVMRITQGGHCSFNREALHNENAKIGEMPLGDTRYDYAGEVVGWFDRWMKPETETGPMPAAYTAYMADGDWLETDTISTSGTTTLYLSQDGALTSDPGKEKETISYVYDPENPVISNGGEIAGVGDDQHDGAYDQSEIEARDDVIVFTGPELTEAMDLFGYANVGLSVSSDRPDTDFTVKIVDVFPDGRAFNIGDTILRMRYRDGIESEVFMEPGEVYDVALPPILLSRRIEAGHKIRVEVSSSNFPTYARNLNTTANPYTSTEFEIAGNTIHIGDGSASFIRLPILD